MPRKKSDFEKSYDFTGWVKLERPIVVHITPKIAERIIEQYEKLKGDAPRYEFLDLDGHIMRIKKKLGERQKRK